MSGYKKPEEKLNLKESLLMCSGGEVECKKCMYYGRPDCEDHLMRGAANEIKKLESRISELTLTHQLDLGELALRRRQMEMLLEGLD